MDSASRFKEDVRGMAHAMLARGVSPGEIGNFVKYCGSVMDHADDGGESYAEEIASAAYAQMERLLARGVSHSREQQLIRWTRWIVSWIEIGTVDFSAAKRSKRIPLGGQLDAELDDYVEDLRRRGMADGTVVKWGGYARRFMSFLSERGVESIADVTVERIDEFVEWVSGRHEQSGLAGELSMLRSLLGFADSKGLTENARWFVPRGRYVRQAPVPAFTEAELAAIIGAVDNTTSRGKRDLAMILLAAKTGVRSSEVVALKLADIDWEKRALLVRQEKTRSQLLLPVPDDVLDALADYILNARPDAGFGEVFLTLRAPFGPFKRGCALWWVCKPYYDAAGVLEGKTGTAARCGLHRMRHTAATKLMSSTTPPESIAAALGHAKIETTMMYASVDEKRLRECCLALPGGGRHAC